MSSVTAALSVPPPASVIVSTPFSNDFDRAGVLVAVVDAVVVGVGVARIQPRAELAAVLEAVVVLVTAALLVMQRQVMTLLPLVWDAVVVAVLAVESAPASISEAATASTMASAKFLRSTVPPVVGVRYYRC